MRLVPSACGYGLVPWSKQWMCLGICRRWWCRGVGWLRRRMICLSRIGWWTGRAGWSGRSRAICVICRRVAVRRARSGPMRWICCTGSDLLARPTALDMWPNDVRRSHRSVTTKPRCARRASPREPGRDVPARKRARHSGHTVVITLLRRASTAARGEGPDGACAIGQHAVAFGARGPQAVLTLWLGASCSWAV